MRSPRCWRLVVPLSVSLALAVAGVAVRLHVHGVTDPGTLHTPLSLLAQGQLACAVIVSGPASAARPAVVILRAAVPEMLSPPDGPRAPATLQRAPPDNPVT